MSAISVVIIAKNEEKMIEDAIASVSFCNEIIVVDSGSTDKTIEKAKRKGAEIVSVVTDDFSKLRNEGLQRARGPWVLYIDADERVSEKLKEQILAVIKDENAKSAYRIRRKNFYLSNYEWPKVEQLERFFKKSALKKWYGRLHESAEVEGEVGELAGYLLHYTHRSLSEMLDKTITWSSTEADLRFRANHPPVVWWRFPRVMLTAFLESYVSQGGWRVGTPGLIESMYQAFSSFVTYAKLWEMQQESKIERIKIKN